MLIKIKNKANKLVQIKVQFNSFKEITFHQSEKTIKFNKI